MITLRKATLADALHLYVWRNHPSTRSMMRNPGDISWEGHREWLRNVLEDSDRHLFIGFRESQPVGSVRFDVAGTAAEISVMTAPECRGGGVGTALIRQGTAWMFANTGVQTIQARVKTTNPASRRAFEKAGYVVETLTTDEVVLRAVRETQV